MKAFTKKVILKENTGVVYAVGVVRKAANNFKTLLLNENDEYLIELKISSDEKQEIIGILLQSNQLIPRLFNSQLTYIYWDKNDVIETQKRSDIKEINFDHIKGEKIKAHVEKNYIETRYVDYLKSDQNFWLVTMKVDSKEDWEKVKSIDGGISLEGRFLFN